ncbi:MAG: MATE family efflux transporter [Pseudomonadota bacterium]
MTDTAQAPTNKRVLRLAAPIVLSNATVPLMGAVDVAVVGQMDAAAPIGAVGMGAIILSTVYWLFAFLRMGTVGLVGQARGAGDMAEVSAWLTRCLLLAGGGGLALIALQSLIFSGAFALSPASAEVEDLTRTYLSIRIWTAPAAIAVFALTGWLVAMERIGAVFWMQLLMNGLNIALSALFVLQFQWGVAGVAWATVVADLVGAGLGLWLARSAFAHPAWRAWDRVFERAKLVRMAALNSDIMLRSAMITTILTSFVFFGAGFGDATLAGNEILLQFVYITSYAMDGISVSAETLVASAYGRGERGWVRRATLLSAGWGLGAAVLFGLFFWLAGPALIDLMAKDAGVREAARIYLPWMVFMPLASVGAWILDGVFVGATRGRDMRNMMALAFVCFWLSLALLMPAYGNHGLWGALIISFFARGVTLAVRYPALERAAG